MMLFVSGLTTIPIDVLEASEIDGAGYFARLRYVMLPYLMPSINITLVLACVNSFKGFDAIFVMTKGGPNHASDVLALTMYQKTFESGLYGYGSAIAVVIVVICIVLTVTLNRAFKRDSLGE